MPTVYSLFIVFHYFKPQTISIKKWKEWGFHLTQSGRAYLLFLPTVARLLRRGQAIAGVDVNNPRIIYLTAARANLNISTGFLIVSAGFDGFCQYVFPPFLRIPILYVKRLKSQYIVLQNISKTQYIVFFLFWVGCDDWLVIILEEILRQFSFVRYAFTCEEIGHVRLLK